MRRSSKVAFAGLMLAAVAACYRLPLRIKENDATGYEDVGIPLIEAVEYTLGGRDLRVVLEAPGYVTVIVVDPARGASVRFRRGELVSQFAAKGVHRYPLDRLSSPMLLSQFMVGRAASPTRSSSHADAPPALRVSVFDPTPINSGTGNADSTRREFLLSSRSVSSDAGPVSTTHVVVLVTERPLDLVAVATRLARGSLDPAAVAHTVANVVEGGRWMAAVAPLRGQ